MTVCAHCGQWREAPELLLVTDVSDGSTRYVCRPGVSPGCFAANVRHRDRDRIEAA